MKIIYKLIALSILLAAAGCSDNNTSYHIKQYNGGILVGEWDSDGTYTFSNLSNRYIFRDKKTRKNVTISGDVQITVNN